MFSKKPQEVRHEILKDGNWVKNQDIDKQKAQQKKEFEVIKKSLEEDRNG
jgi:hypothetical protein